MSAFPETGRSDQQKLGKIKVRFRPIADIDCAIDTSNFCVSLILKSVEAVGQLNRQRKHSHLGSLQCRDRP